jgi:hypothetical protein
VIAAPDRGVLDPMRGVALTFVILATAACGGDDAGDGPDGPPSPPDAGPTDLAFRSPVAAATVLGSIVVEVEAGAAIERVDISVDGVAAFACTLTTRPFLCLVDAGIRPSGPITLTAHGATADGLGPTASVTVDRRPFSVDACPEGNPIDCIAARVTAGTSAGYAGLSYHDMDDGHANYNTSAMPGIEHQVNQASAGSDPWHMDPARIVVANQSQAYNYPDGWASIPRGGSITPVGALWEQSKLFLWPEHRDHGHTDFLPWQTPTFVLSQGSSGSELDEVGKLLHILAALAPDVRAALHDGHLLMPALVMLHRRARLTTDVAYLDPSSHTPALADADVGREGIQLAASVRPDELPPLAALTLESATVPPDWTTAGVLQLETGPYAMVWSAYNAPAAPPAGTLSIVVDLAPASRDAGGRELAFFARVMRGDAEHVRVTQLSPSRFQIDAEWPASVTETVNGQPRASARATVAVVAHNGLWMSAPVFVSVFGGAPYAHAPDSNNLD